MDATWILQKNKSRHQPREWRKCPDCSMMRLLKEGFDWARSSKSWLLEALLVTINDYTACLKCTTKTDILCLTFRGRKASHHSLDPMSHLASSWKETFCKPAIISPCDECLRQHNGTCTNALHANVLDVARKEKHHCIQESGDVQIWCEDLWHLPAHLSWHQHISLLFTCLFWLIPSPSMQGWMLARKACRFTPRSIATTLATCWHLLPVFITVVSWQNSSKSSFKAILHHSPPLSLAWMRLGCHDCCKDCHTHLRNMLRAAARCWGQTVAWELWCTRIVASMRCWGLIRMPRSFKTGIWAWSSSALKTFSLYSVQYLLFMGVPAWLFDEWTQLFHTIAWAESKSLLLAQVLRICPISAKQRCCFS